MKDNTHFNMQRKFQVNDTNIFGKGEKESQVGNHRLLYPNFESLPYAYPRVGSLFHLSFVFR